MINIESATCEFRRADGTMLRALDAIDLTIGEGEFVCLLGRSGHGKSTLLRSLAGLNPLTSGRIVVNGTAIHGPGAERSMVFQEDTVFPWMTVLQNVCFGLAMQGKGRDAQEREAMHWLDLVGLSANAKSWPKELSGGMRKRVAIASAFATGAPILLMDEPFGALDYVTRMELQNLLIRLWRETRRTIVFVTHDIEEALVLAERVVMLRGGRMVLDAPAVLPRPRTADVRASAEALDLTHRIFACLANETRPENA
ncbi:ABC transporter ATP-binding protein [Paracoccus yeei]|jgi:NitT/TauT family transport system ATP-binding protein|uniref:ABC transporter ATP-binding protein n=1 Tax=Paracoccus yeei TaxID=147645 RepID=UPI003BF8BF84